jgi:nucleoside-diphosphate-sugar epimerase
VQVLVTGGNGFLGRKLVVALQERGDQVRVHALPHEDTSWLERRGVALYRGDLRDPASLTAPMQGVEAVLHLAAMVGVWRSLEDYYAVNVRGTENVCRAALAAHVKRLVHVSGAIVYDMPAIGRPAREDDPLAPLDEPYSVTKAQGDELVQRLIREEHLPAVIIRPGTMLGPGDRLNFGRIADRLRSGKAIVVGTGRNAVPYVSIDDIVRGILLALDAERAIGQVYNLGDDRFITQAEMLSTIAEGIGAPPPRLHVPYALLYAIGYLAERVADLTGNKVPPIVTRHGVKLYGADNRLAIDKARRELGYEPGPPLRETLRRTAEWYVQECADGASTSRSLAGRVAIVTGASSGIGAASARELARRGARVVLAARRAHELDVQVRAIAAEGGSALAVPTDVTDVAQIAALLSQAHEAFGRVDLLVNNAAMSCRKPVVQTSCEEITQLLDVGLLGTILMSRAVLPEMLERRRGTIICVGSVQSRVAVEPLYSAMKFGVRGFSLALRRQLAESGVSVSLVLPGNVRTAMTSHLRERMPEPELIADVISRLAINPRREVIVPLKYRGLVWLEEHVPWFTELVYRRRRRREAARATASTSS